MNHTFPPPIVSCVIETITRDDDGIHIVRVHYPYYDIALMAFRAYASARKMLAIDCVRVVGLDENGKRVKLLREAY